MIEIEFNLPKVHNFGKNRKRISSEDVTNSIKKEFQLLCSGFGTHQTIRWYKMIGYSEDKLKEFML